MTISIRETEYPLRLSVGALARLGDQFGKSITDLGEGRVDTCMQIIWCSMSASDRAEISYPDLLDWADEIDIKDSAKLFETVGKLAEESAGTEAKKPRRSGPSSALKSA